MARTPFPAVGIGLHIQLRLRVLFWVSSSHSESAKRRTSVRPKDDRAKRLAKHLFTGAGPTSEVFWRKLDKGGWRDTRRGAGDTHLGPHTWQSRVFLMAGNLLMKPMTLPVVSRRRVRGVFESACVNKEYRS
jgi:hypothetical protein